MADSILQKSTQQNKDQKAEEKILKGDLKAIDHEDSKTQSHGKTSFDWTKRKSDSDSSVSSSKGKPFFGMKRGSGITIKLAPDAKKKKPETVVKKKAGSVAAAFNDDESEEEEEIPPEAKMRMRNIGRNTPTSAGPNSFNKGKQGFTHHGKVFEKQLKEMKPPS